MFDEESKELRWFLLPSEAYSCMHNNGDFSKTTQPPFTPVSYPRDQPPVTRSTIQPPSKNNCERGVGSKHVESTDKMRESFQEGMISSLSNGFQELSDENRNELAESETSSASSQNKRRLGEKLGEESEEKVVKLSPRASPQASSDAEKNPNAAEHSSESQGNKTANTTRKFTCEGNVCFTKRKPQNSSKQPELPTAKYKWHPPPKQIFKPTVQVRQV